MSEKTKRYVVCIHNEGSEHSLELRKISKHFGAIQALTDVDLTLEAGEVLGLMGDNGAGKSTLVKIVAGNFPPSVPGSPESADSGPANGRRSAHGGTPRGPRRARARADRPAGDGRGGPGRERGGGTDHGHGGHDGDHHRGLRHRGRRPRDVRPPQAKQLTLA